MGQSPPVLETSSKVARARGHAGRRFIAPGRFGTRLSSRLSMHAEPAQDESNSTLAGRREPQADGSTHFRVWAPEHRRVEVVLEPTAGGAQSPRELEMQPAGNGYFALRGKVRAAARYRYRLDGGGACPIRPPAFSPRDRMALRR